MKLCLKGFVQFGGKIMGLLKDIAKKVAFEAAATVGAVVPEVNELLYDKNIIIYLK